MKKKISEAIQDGNKILLCLDANESWDSDKSEIRDMTNSLGMKDVVSHKIMPPPPTYERKGVSRRIDFILATQAILDSVVEVSMASKSTGNSCGDHNAMMIDLDIRKLFFLNDKDSMSPTSRRLKSSDVKGVKKYVSLLKDGLETHNVEKRLRLLQQELKGTNTINEYQKKIYEGIDQDVFRLCTNAEKKIRKGRLGNYMWSPKLQLRIYIWNI